MIKKKLNQNDTKKEKTKNHLTINAANKEMNCLKVHKTVPMK